MILITITNSYFCIQTRPAYWTELNLLASSVHFGRKPKRKLEPKRTGASQNHAWKRYCGTYCVVFPFYIYLLFLCVMLPLT